MRVLLIGSSNRWRMESAVEKALRRAGHETLLIDDRRRKRAIGRSITQRWVLARARMFSPDFVFLSKCLALDPETVSRIVDGIPNAMWYHDPQWHRDLDRPDIGHIARIGRLADVFFVTGFQKEWAAHGLRAKFLPAAGDSAIRPVPADPRFSSDVCFIGTGYDPERAGVLLEIAKRHRVSVWGLGWEEWQDRLHWGGRPVEGREFAAVCSSARITLGINPARASGGESYTSDRTWMVMLAGAFYLGQGTPGLMTMLRGEEHCAWYTDTESCLRQIERYLASDDERQRISIAGEKFVRDHHTYDQRISNLLSGSAFDNPLSAA